jgi:hypothetical protein
MRPVAELPFSVTFTGPAVDQGRIPAYDLAESLFALDEMVRATNALINPGMPDVYIEVRGARPGSFLIDLAVRHADVIGRAVDLFASQPMSALANIFEVLFSGRSSVMWLLRKTRGAPIEQLGPSSTDPAAVMVRMADGAEVQISRDTLAARGDVHIVRAIERFSEPLESEGVEVIEVGGVRDRFEVRLTKDDLPSIEAAALPATKPDCAPTHTDQYHHRELTVIQPTLKGNLMWRFEFGPVRFLAHVEDDDFVDKVATRQIMFGHNDILICDFEITYSDADRPRPTGVVHKVHRYIPVQAPEPPKPPPTLFDP